jgi:hypothetical protein
MAPSTRQTDRATPPNRGSARCEANSAKKRAFFNAYDARNSPENHLTIARRQNITSPTARRWLRQREIFGSPSYHRIRKCSDNIGRPKKITREQCQMLISPSRNPVRDQLYDAQLEYHNIHASTRTLKRKLGLYTKGARRYKQAYIRKQISPANRQKRVEYGLKHLGKSVDDFWQYIFFTDEAHIDPTSMKQGYILREKGTRYDSENIQQRGEKKGIKLHIAAWVNWHSKSEKLEFYNDENDSIIKPKRPPKPRKTMYETEEEFSTRILEWEASLPHEAEVKPKGNQMTQKYYCERLLPIYCEAIGKARLYNAQNWLLQEDGDPSHGMKKSGLSQHLKDQYWVENLTHPPQSPDLNPMEGVWNILKQRIRRRIWNSMEELKEALQEEWSKITIEEVRARIKDMPERCELLVKTSGLPIKSALW